MRRMTIAIVVAALAALSAGAVPAPARHGDDNATRLEGRVLSVDRSARTFRLKDAERGTATIAVTRATTFERITFAKLRPGRHVQVRYRVSGGRKVATKIEPSGSTSHS